MDPDKEFTPAQHFPLERMIDVHPFWPSSLVLSREALQDLGGWDVALKGVRCEDIDFVFRALSRFPIVIGWRPSLRYRSHAGNNAGDSLENLKGHIFIWQRLLDREPIPSALRLAVQTILIKKRHQLLWQAFRQGDHQTVASAYAALRDCDLSWLERAKALVSRIRWRQMERRDAGRTS